MPDKITQKYSPVSSPASYTLAKKALAGALSLVWFQGADAQKGCDGKSLAAKGVEPRYPESFIIPVGFGGAYGALAGYRNWSFLNALAGGAVMGFAAGSVGVAAEYSF